MTTERILCRIVAPTVTGQIKKILTNKKVLKYIVYSAIVYYYPSIGICMKLIKIVF
jgi:hypothetical protein